MNIYIYIYIYIYNSLNKMTLNNDGVAVQSWF